MPGGGGNYGSQQNDPPQQNHGLGGKMSVNNRDCDPWRKEHVSRTARLQPRRAGKSLLPRTRLQPRTAEKSLCPRPKELSARRLEGSWISWVKEIIGETTGIILPPILETMSKVEFCPDLSSEKAPVLNYQGPQPQYSQQGCMQGGGIMPLQEGTHIQDSKVATKESREVITPQDSKVTTQNSRKIIIPQDKAITKGSREIIITQTKGALQKEIGGIMTLLGKEITGDDNWNYSPTHGGNYGQGENTSYGQHHPGEGQRSAQMEQMGMQGEQGNYAPLGPPGWSNHVKAQPPLSDLTEPFFLSVFRLSMGGFIVQRGRRMVY
ncbi:hypothetical protein OIU77_023937 [Salix suchowensis]|uniref:Uncharacterized protein n=1 Tax=Salix suchowensis TaxID=1278906 RepID=A0ABQ9C6F6_9ROSI|nr:hypothetical protein OIU77_023937 [Salix suchowensis]